MSQNRSNLPVIHARKVAILPQRELTQADYVIFEEWVITMDGQMALAWAEQLQRQRKASNELHQFNDELSIAG